jgi:hypothetical protein
VNHARFALFVTLIRNALSLYDPFPSLMMMKRYTLYQIVDAVSLSLSLSLSLPFPRFYNLIFDVALVLFVAFSLKGLDSYFESQVNFGKTKTRY